MKIYLTRKIFLPESRKNKISSCLTSVYLSLAISISRVIFTYSLSMIIHWNCQFLFFFWSQDGRDVKKKSEMKYMLKIIFNFFCRGSPASSYISLSDAPLFLLWPSDFSSNFLNLQNIFFFIQSHHVSLRGAPFLPLNLQIFIKFFFHILYIHFFFAFFRFSIFFSFFWIFIFGDAHKQNCLYHLLRCNRLKSVSNEIKTFKIPIKTIKCNCSKM